MAARAATLSRGSALGTGTWALTLGLGGLLVGAVTTLDPFFGAALVLALGLVLLIAARPGALPLFLVFTMFTESVALGPGLRIGRIAGGLALLVLAYYFVERGSGGLRLNALVLLAGAYGAWSLASVYWADEDGAVFGVLASYALAISYMLAFAILVRTTGQLRGIFLVLAGGSFVFGVVSFVSYLLFGQQYLETGLGATGLQGDKNYFAVYQVIALPATLTLAAFERRPQRRALLYAVVVVIGLSVAASLSRTGLIALVASVLVILALPWRFFFRRPGQKLTFVFALAAATLVVSASGSTPFLERAQSIFDEQQEGGGRGSGRIDLWRAALTASEESTTLGIGAGNFEAQSIALLRRTPGADIRAAYAQEGFVTHNIYLETLAELGPVGLAILLGILAGSTRLLLVAFRRARAAGSEAIERYSVALLVSLLAFAISGIFLSNQLGKPLWILVGLALALDVMTRNLAPAAEPTGPVAIPPYHPPMAQKPEEGERAVGAIRQLEDERSRVARLRAQLEMRELRLRELEESLGVEATAFPPRVAELAHLELGVQTAELEERRQELESAAELAAKREVAAARLHAELAQRSRELERREQELEVAVSEPPAVVAPEPTATLPEPADGALGDHSLDELERLVEATPGASAEQLEEWRYYLFYLREFANFEGRLPRSFDPLVGDIFGALLPDS